MPSDDRFRCYLVTKDDRGQFQGTVVEKSLADLPDGDVLVRVTYSSLNYKDALSATGHPGVTRRFPHVPGIDAVGSVVESRSPQWRPGDEVIVTSYDLGQNTWGGYAQYIRVPAAWLVRLPSGMTHRQSMVLGTAGLTAGLCLLALTEHGVSADRGEVVVSGASGGVGSLAVALLAKAGFKTVASTGKPEAHYLLHQLGAVRVVGREELDDASQKPLLPVKWAGAVDTVGGRTLATVLRATDRGGCVTACGLVGGTELPLTVYPFILRGIQLVGIDSGECPHERRERVWQLFAGDWRLDHLEPLVTEISLDELGPAIERILAGRAVGRVVVRV